MYRILIKDKSNLYRFLTVKEEIMKEEKTTVTDSETQEVKEVTNLVGTGEYKVVTYETDSKEELEKKSIELLNTYTISDFMLVDTQEYSVDLVFSSEKNNSV